MAISLKRKQVYSHDLEKFMLKKIVTNTISWHCSVQNTTMKAPAVMGLQNSKKQENLVLFKLEKETLNTPNAPQSVPTACLAIFTEH